MNKIHSQLSITVTQDDPLSPATTSTVEVLGCHDCASKALAHALLTNDKVKNLVNKAVRLANEKKARTEN